MLNSDFIKDDFPDFTLQSFLRTLKRPIPAGSICGREAGSSVQGSKHRVRSRAFNSSVTVLRAGSASGPLIGGNLSILCASLGTPWQPSFNNKILFFEDLDEVPYRFDRMLTQLLNAGQLQNVAGIAIGINANCFDPRAKKTNEYRQTCEDVFRERLLPLKVPIIAGLPFGHVPMNATLPIGVRATLDGVKGDLIIEEAAVK